MVRIATGWPSAGLGPEIGSTNQVSHTHTKHIVIILVGGSANTTCQPFVSTILMHPKVHADLSCRNILVSEMGEDATPCARGEHAALMCQV